MQTPINLLSNNISDLFARVSRTHKVTQADRYGLMTAILNDTITYEERRAIDRLLHCAYRGRLQIVNEISTATSTP